MAFPIFPIATPGSAQPVRSPHWIIKKTMEWSNSKQRTVNGRMLVFPYFVNPVWHWEFTYGYIRDNPNDIQGVLAPYTDLKTLIGFFGQMKGGGGEFLYTPPDSVVSGQAIAAPDANNNCELRHTVGGISSTYSGTGATLPFTESVQYMTGLAVLCNGAAPPGFSVANPSTVSPYPGYVIQWGASTPTAPITASFNYSYICRFSEDTQEYDQFMSNLHSLNSLKFEQVHI